MEHTKLVKSVFHFKTDKLKDAAGNTVGEGKKHPSVTVDLPIPTVEFLAAMLADPANYAKEIDLLLATIAGQVYTVARSQINDFREVSKDAEVTAAALNYDKLSWTAIANMPKGERASTVPSEDDIKAFLDSYLQVMPAALNKPKQNIENHIILFQQAFKKQRSQKDILEVFVNAISVYTTTVSEETATEHADVLDYFINRLSKMLASEEKITLDNL